MDPIKPNSNPDSEQAGETFYNVMPQDGSGPQVFSQPETPQTMTDTSAGESTTFTLPHSNRKVVMITVVVIVVAILGAFGYFGYRYAQQHKNTVAVNENTDQPTNTEQPPANKDVTTPPDWQSRYFSAEVCADMNVCADSADPDRDGLSNLEEYNTKTDPNNADSDADGLSDGDEVHVFGGSPLTDRTNSAEEYKDSDYAKGGYDITTNVKYSETQLRDIKSKIKDKGLHQPTIKTLGADNLKQYDFTDTSGTVPDSSSIDSSIDQSPTAKLARDTSRSASIQKIAGGLIKYKAAKGTYPDTADFNEMVTKVKSYIGVATNYADPINKDKYVYGYVTASGNQDFTLLYFSETQNLVIKYTSQQAELDQIKNNASANDDKRLHDVENLARALGIYSDAHTDVNSTQGHVFPTDATYKAELVDQKYITEIPKDPRTGQDYVYEAGEHYDTFTLKAVFDNPPKGQTGYLCNQEECHNY